MQLAPFWGSTIDCYYVYLPLSLQIRSFDAARLSGAG